MIHYVCGLIGAGKSTYVKELITDKDILIDWDDIKLTLNDTSSEITTQVLLYALQLSVSRKLNVWITGTFPTEEELDILKDYSVKYYWMECSIDRARRNIINRSRNNEAESGHLKALTSTNAGITARAKYFIEENDVEIIDVYNEGERW